MWLFYSCFSNHFMFDKMPQVLCIQVELKKEKINNRFGLQPSLDLTKYCSSCCDDDSKYKLHSVIGEYFPNIT